MHNKKYKPVRQIIVCAVILVLVCIICRLVFFRSTTIYLPANSLLYDPVTGEARDPNGPEGDFVKDLEIHAETPGIITADDIERHNDKIGIKIRPEGSGDTWIELKKPGSDNTFGMTQLHVGAFHTVYDTSTGAFTGDSIVLASVTIFCLLVSLICLNAYRQARGPEFYSYQSIFYSGFFLFSLCTGITMLLVTVQHIIDPAGYLMLNAYSAISGAPATFIQITSPLILVFAFFMIISNLELLRHESVRLQNLLGILTGLLMIAGAFLVLYLKHRDFIGSEWEYRIQSTVENSFAVVYVYFECMLAGAVICGLRAARHVPPFDRDFVIIHGCWFRKDGSLPPLLQGRADRAADFWKQQKKATGKEAVLIPSGGQGPGESMSEAEAIKRYLLTCGIPENCILKEDQSTNTYQNMVCSKKLIDQAKKNAKVGFSTTNYHVFRSGLWAELAGLPAEGMGSRTRWWYWPNAFMRECVGLLRNRIVQEILLLIFFVAFFAVLSMALGY